MESPHNVGDIVEGRYQIQKILGEGGCGTTYQALDQESGNSIALKVLSFSQTSNWKNIELIEREAQVLARINHPAIPSNLDYFQVDSDTDRCFYLVQQLAEGQTLAALVESGWRSSESIVHPIAIQLLDILIYLHRQAPPIIHRDIKPDNIIRSSEGKLFLVDFGAVQDAYQSTFLRRSTVVGTFGYMAPEQFQGQAVPSSDLYGLGATLIFLLTNRSPAELPVERLKIKFRDRISLSDTFADWLEILLEPDIEDRFSSARAALKFLEENRRKKTKQKKSLSPSLFLVGTGVAFIAVAAGITNHRYPILNAFGFSANIHSSIHSGVIEINQYLAAGGNPYGRDRNGRTLLHTAVKEKEVGLTKMLIDKGIQIDARDKSGMSPLHYASSIKIIDLLLANGADINAQTTQGQTLLHRAVEQNEAEIVSLLISRGGETNIRDQKGNYPLHIAKTEEIAALLISNGADPKQPDNEGSTFVHQAVREKWQDTLKLLAETGTDFGTENQDHLTPLYIVTFEHPSADIAAFLVEKGARFSRTDITTYQQQKYPQIHISWKVLINGGFGVHTVDQYGRTLLHLLTPNTPTDEVEFLIANGANVNARDNDGTTPLLALAMFIGDKAELAKVLLSAGADVNAKGGRGRTQETVLDRAKRSRDIEFLDLVIEAKTKRGFE